MLKKRNKLGKMLLIIMSASILSSVNVFAEEKSNLNQDITTNSIKETLASDFDFDATTGTITKYKGSDSNVIIPSEINGIKVTSIGDDAFEENPDITSVEIPDGVTSIGVWSFYKCSELTKVIIPDSVTSISGIKSFSLPRIQVFYVNSESVKQLLINKVEIDESKIILDNESLVSEAGFEFDKTTGTIIKYKGSDSNVIIPSEINGIKVTSIGDDAFEENADITSVEIPDGVTSIGVWSFYKCSELTKVTIPDSVTSINGIKSFSLPRIQVFYVNSERVKQLLINKVKIDESKIILNNQSSSESKSTETTNANNSTQTSVANEINNIFKWEKNSDGTWKLTKGGIIQVGWQQVNGQWYLMNSNGIMQTGWQPASGNWYYLNNSGEMASNTTINGYKVGSDGAWIE